MKISSLFMNLGRQWVESANLLADEPVSAPTSSWKAALLSSLQDQHRRREEGGKETIARDSQNHFVNSNLDYLNWGCFLLTIFNFEILLFLPLNMNQ